MGDLHGLLKCNLSNTEIACFGFRPSRVFNNAHVRVSIITGSKDATANNENPLLTSDFIVFTEENREEKFKHASYERTDGLALGREEIGDNETSYNVLPKVGSSVKHSVLETLKDESDTTMGDIFVRAKPSNGGYKIFKQRGGLHWINPMRENLRPNSSGVLPFYFTDEYERDLSFLIYNSSLYYMYWLTYSNQHNQDWPHFSAFPYPDNIDRGEHEEGVHELASQLWEEMESRFDYGHEKFQESAMRELKPIINTIDEVLAETFGLSDKELEYVTNYLTDWDGGRKSLEPTVEPVYEFE